MSLITGDIKDQLITLFKTLKTPVHIVLFTSESNCETCTDTQNLLKDVADLSESIHFESLDLEANSAYATELGIVRTPSFALLNDKKDNLGIVFNGIPAGHEFSSFLTGLLEVGGAGEAIPDKIKARIEAIQKPVHIKVFVTLGCPHCSGAVAKAHRLALENPHIFAEMIECGTFPEEADKYNVSGVPKIVFNETNELMGDQPMESFLTLLEKL
jgi:glutaredoxin-like protein